LLLHVAFAFIKLSLSWPMIFFHLIFSPPHPVEEGSDRAAREAPHVQPRSNHHNLDYISIPLEHLSIHQ